MAAAEASTGGVLITGASGLLGRAILAEFKQCSSLAPVVGTAFSRAGPGLVKVDLTDAAACEELVLRHRPAVLIHAAAERRPDKVDEDPSAVQALNVHCTYTLARAAAQVQAAFIVISTDYIFPGTSPPYGPRDFPEPLNTYGHSKLRAEYAALAGHPSAVVLRVPVLYGPCTSPTESAVTTLLTAAQAAAGGSGAVTPVDAWAVRSPTFTPDVARVLRRLAEKCVAASAEGGEGGGVSGIFHWSADVQCTKYDMALCMAQLLGSPAAPPVDFDTALGGLEGVKTPPSGAPRPKDCTLAVDALLALGVHAGVAEGDQAAPEGVPVSPSTRGVPFVLGLRAALASCGVQVVDEVAAVKVPLTNTSYALATPSTTSSTPGSASGDGKQ